MDATKFDIWDQFRIWFDYMWTHVKLNNDVVYHDIMIKDTQTGRQIKNPGINFASGTLYPTLGVKSSLVAVKHNYMDFEQFVSSGKINDWYEKFFKRIALKGSYERKSEFDQGATA